MDIDGFLQAYDTIGCCAFYVLLWFTEQFSGPDRLQCDKKRAPYSVISCYIRMKTITYYFIFFLSSFLVHPTCSGCLLLFRFIFIFYLIHYFSNQIVEEMELQN